MHIQQAHNEFVQSRNIREEMKRSCAEVSCRENQYLETWQVYFFGALHLIIILKNDNMILLQIIVNY